MAESGKGVTGLGLDFDQEVGPAHVGMDIDDRRRGTEGVHPGIVTAFFVGATAGQFLLLRSSGLSPRILVVALVLPWIALAGSLFLKRR